MQAFDMRGLNPAPVTPFTRDGAVDYAAIQRLGSWLASVDGVKSLTVLGHAGEGTFLERDEQFKVIEAFRKAVDDKLPIIAGITLERLITEQFPLARDRMVDLTLQILAALSEAHGLGILHRDLKPENILVQQLRTHGELAVVLDFGIAKLMEEPDAAKPANPKLTTALRSWSREIRSAPCVIPMFEDCSRTSRHDNDGNLCTSWMVRPYGVVHEPLPVDSVSVSFTPPSCVTAAHTNGLKVDPGS